MKPIYILLLIVAICIVIAYMFIRLENTKKDVSILQKKFENINNLLENKNNTEKQSNLTNSATDNLSNNNIKKYNDIKNILKSTTDNNSPKDNKPFSLFESLGIPNIFELFNNKSYLNKLNINNPINLNNFVKHPNMNFDDVITSDDVSLATSEVLITNVDFNKNNNINLIQSNIAENVNNLETYKNDLEFDKTEIDNNEQIEEYSNSEKCSSSNNNEINANIMNATIQSVSNIDINNLTANSINTNKVNLVEDNIINTNKLDKKYLELLKLNDLKELAKKNKINLLNGKKIKNKGELINDLMNL
jgi:hypothetical protein